MISLSSAQQTLEATPDGNTSPTQYQKRLDEALNQQDPWVLSYWLSELPSIHYCSEAHLPFLVSHLQANALPIVHFVQPMWHLDPDYAFVLADWLKSVRPNDRLIFLLNDNTAIPEFHRQGMEAHFIHQNAFLDETQWRPATSPLPPRFDAIYNARMVPFKRHNLAKAIGRLALICPQVGEGADLWSEQMKTELPDAFRFGNEGPNLSLGEVREVIWQSQVGLCLSGEEGGMYVAGEYGLCGLPIVSTPSRGGRDAFVQIPGNFIVPPDAECIARAVNELKANPPDPTMVRMATLRVINEHRQKFISLGQSVYNSYGCGRDFGRDFYLRLINKMGGFKSWSSAKSTWYSLGA